MKRAVKRESDLEQELRTRVLALGGMCVKITVPGERGHPDRLVVLPRGRVVMVELKNGSRGRVSPHQSLYLTRYQALGVSACVIRNSADIDALLR